MLTHIDWDSPTSKLAVQPSPLEPTVQPSVNEVVPHYISKGELLPWDLVEGVPWRSFETIAAPDAAKATPGGTLSSRLRDRHWCDYRSVLESTW